MEAERESEITRDQDEATTGEAAEGGKASEQLVASEIPVRWYGSTSVLKWMTVEMHENSAALDVAFVTKKLAQKMVILAIFTVI